MFSQLNSPPRLYPCLRFTEFLAVAAQDSGPSGPLVLSRKNFAFSTSYRFIPAHKNPHFTQNPSMHYEKAPRFRRSKPDEAPAPLRCVVQGFAALRRRSRVTAVVCSAKGLQESLVKLAGEWHFTLRESQASTRMSFPPRRQLK